MKLEAGISGIAVDLAQGNSESWRWSLSGLPPSRYPGSNRVGRSLHLRRQLSFIYPEAKLRTDKTGEPAEARRLMLSWNVADGVTPQPTSFRK
ncbi:MAG: hypothetical protein C5B58_05120 [Acidobacteria bacterium]|nr:MAG: hypothetical protein C5B58_05120 [Acidobacteriota bacterium]